MSFLKEKGRETGKEKKKNPLPKGEILKIKQVICT